MPPKKGEMCGENHVLSSCRREQFLTSEFTENVVIISQAMVTDFKKKKLADIEGISSLMKEIFCTKVMVHGD
jgi:hypothetical protein